MADFANKKVLIVGGTTGIGLAAGRVFADSGARVTVAGRSAERVAAAVDVIGSGSNGIVTDVRIDSDVEVFAENSTVYDHVVVTVTERPTIMGRADELAMDSAYSAMNTKFWGAYRVARSVRLVESGSLTLVSGVLAIRPGRSSALQSAINAALEGLGRALAVEWAPSRVNIVSPGVIENAPLLTKMSADERARFDDGLLLGRPGGTADVADAIVFAAGNRNLTGAVLNVDGGAAITPSRA